MRITNQDRKQLDFHPVVSSSSKLLFDRLNSSGNYSEVTRPTSSVTGHDLPPSHLGPATTRHDLGPGTTFDELGRPGILKRGRSGTGTRRFSTARDRRPASLGELGRTGTTGDDLWRPGTTWDDMTRPWTTWDGRLLNQKM